MSSDRRSNAVRSAFHMATVNALRLPGLAMVTVATGPCMQTSIRPLSVVLFMARIVGMHGGRENYRFAMPL
ncbi:hypothetical protein AVS7_02784 [Acidovorax sp. MR-S7]|nr:hypothetical protein AVS7_02784 [Acidovorax sp. MR-S7]